MSHLTESSDQHPDVVVLKFDPPHIHLNVDVHKNMPIGHVKLVTLFTQRSHTVKNFDARWMECVSTFRTSSAQC